MIITRKNGAKMKLILLDAEFSGEQRYPKFSNGEKYGRLRFISIIMQQVINLQKFKFHVSDQDTR